jgi:outer membrane protein assembly factor BamB/tetratricopeptide (TPR) repeat protein
MLFRTRRLAATLGAALLLLTLPVARAQVRQGRPFPTQIGDEDKAGFTDAVTVPVNRQSKQLIQAAQDYIAKKEWGTAAECLQQLLEDKQDSFVEIDAASDDKGKPSKRRVSVRNEANRLIGELPPDGLQMYQVKYGQAASESLKEALETNDPARLAEVAQRYLHTKAGADATNLLGTYYLDRGEYLMANLSFERLLGRSDADKLTTKVLFKAALAARRAGDAATAEKWWKKMAEKAGRGELVFGARKVTLEQARAEFEKSVAAGQSGQTDWWVFHGNPARNAQGVGSIAYLEPRWKYDMAPVELPADPKDRPDDRRVREDADRRIREYLQTAFAALDGKPILPTFFPVSANGKLLIRSYDGVHALSLRTENTAQGPVVAGGECWASPTDGGLYAMVSRADRRETLRQWYEQNYHQGIGPTGVFFENSTIGTLSHDGQRVYLVDDLAVPPHPSMTQMNFGGHVSYGAFANQVHYNVLRAINLESGKLEWSIGRLSQTTGKDKDDSGKDKIAGLEFTDTFFLGPPLPLAGKLYVLVEKSTELRLVCLDPGKIVNYQYTDERGQTQPDQCPELVWQQSLGTANYPLPRDSLRRMQAAHLAYADGVLVCPTNAGVILGVDLLSHSLVWSHSYRDPAQQPISDEMQFPRRFRGGFIAGGGMPLSLDRWRPSPPTIQNGKVVFTAYDGDGGALHCLNLRDGRLLWHQKREEDDLYMAGVFGQRVLLVGKGRVRALNLDDGKELWKLPTGMPSGQGVASDNIYYLPLAWAADDAEKKPAILAINLATGKPVGPPAKSRKKEPIGNLLFVDGELVSQTALAVTAFPELKRMLAEIDRRLKSNPTDPVGLAERGELYLDKGDLKAAVEDLRTSLANKPPKDVLGKARDKLHEALTDLLQNDFGYAEKYLPEYRDLCRIDVPADADPVTKQRRADEQLRREANYLSLLGRGREQQGRLLDAFAAYEEFGALTGNKELVSVVDEPNTKSRPDVWSRGRIKGMLDRANPAQRKQLEEAIQKKWESVRGAGDLDAVRRFVSLFGTHFRVGREAQLQLAERLLAAGTPDDLTEAETRLQGLCFSPEVRRQDAPTAARAIEAMIRVYMKRGLYEDAVGFYKQLGTEFANVPVRDGKTGVQLLNELFTDKRFLPYLEPLGISWKGAVRAREENRQFPGNQVTLSVEPEGESLLPFFQRHRLVLDTFAGGNQSWTLRLLDGVSGEEQWRQGGLPAAPYIINPFGQMYGISARQHASPRFAYAAGHTLVLHLKEMVYAFNLAERKELWKYSLYGKDHGIAGQLQAGLNPDDSDNRLVTVTYPDNRQEKLGGVGLVSPSYVILLTRDGLVALDPTRAGTASVLWTKRDVSMRAQLFGDDEHVYVVEPAGDNSPATVRALRAQDGITIPVPEFGRLYAQRIRTDGRRLLLQEDEPQGGKFVRLYDVQTGQDVWKRHFSAGAIVIQCQDPTLTGVIEKDDVVTLLNARTGDVLLRSLILPEHAAGLDSAHLLGDAERYYLALVRRSDGGLSWRASASNAIPSLKINGPLYALDRRTGKLEWVCDFLPHQMLLLEQMRDLPVLLFAANYTKSDRGFERTMAKVTAVDKRTGKLVYDKEFTPNVPFHSLKIDPQAGQIDLVRNDLKIEFRMDDGTTAKAETATPVSRAEPRPAPRLPIMIRR